jgi:hypothetical protein
VRSVREGVGLECGVERYVDCCEGAGGVRRGRRVLQGSYVYIDIVAVLCLWQKDTGKCTLHEKTDMWTNQTSSCI